MQGVNFKKISVALCMVLLPVSVYAAGLGKLNVQSAIGEPLKAEIELISASSEELASITAALASEEAYAEQGIERPASHSTIKIEIAKNALGSPILKLKSSQPISDPFLDMLIQLDWNSGRLLREYTVLLDPPGYKGEAVPQTSTATSRLPAIDGSASNTSGASTTTSDTSTKSGRLKKRIRQAKSHAKPANESEAATDVQPAVATTSGVEYLTEKGDTLSKIAMQIKPEGVSLDQMLVGLYEANKEAFVGNNMNRLKVGQILKPPSEEALAAISRKQASREVKVQTADWNAYRNNLADAVAKTTPNESVADTQPTSGKIKTATEDQSAGAATGPKDVVKLSAGSPADAKNDKSKITALQEEVTAREKGLKEAQDRNAALEKQVTDMKKLLEMKNNSLAEMQKQAQKPTPTPAAEPAKPAEAVQQPAPANPAAVAKPEQPAAAPTPAPVAEKPVVNPPVQSPAPVEEPSFLSGVLSGLDPTLLAGGGGLIALLGGTWLYIRNKRKKNLDDFEQGIMTSGGLKANTVFGNTSSTTSIDTGDTSFLTDFAQSANSGMIDTNDVDPIAEAEVYMAYGRDAQAEEILKDAIIKEPKRYELHLKLLEMYAASKNMSAFEAVSGELYTTLGADSPVWAKVAEIGVKVEPNNPLYQVTTAPNIPPESKLEASDFADSRLAGAEDLNFSIPKNQVEPTQEDGLDFSMDTLEAQSPQERATPPDNLMDFGVTEPAPSAPTMDFSSINQPTIEPTVTMQMPDPSAAVESIEFDTGMLGELDEQADELPSLSFDMAPTEVEPIESPTMEINLGTTSFENTVAAETVTLGNEVKTDELDSFSFDVATMNPQDDKTQAIPEKSTNVIDFSSISLDMNEPEDVSTSSPAGASAGDEPVEVETKLELVAAYIEMDDKEGARELLDEVMKEGGANQRKRAEELIKKIS